MLCPVFSYVIERWQYSLEWHLGRFSDSELMHILVLFETTAQTLWV